MCLHVHVCTHSCACVCVSSLGAISCHNMKIFMQLERGVHITRNWDLLPKAGEKMGPLPIATWVSHVRSESSSPTQAYTASANIKSTISGLPWRSSGEESTCLWRWHRFKPWSRTIPHAVGQLSPCTTATAPAL